jgi:predicted  nucleic acid-binding Zn-ribbon protein
MKKYGLLFVVLLLLTISIVLNYNLDNKLKASISIAETLEVKLQETNINNDALELKISTLAEEMNNIDNQLKNKTEDLKLIDDKLDGDGEILEKIDELINENDKFKKELTALIVELNTLEKEKSTKIEGVILTETQLKQWDRDIQDILELLDARISVLEEGISNLPILSIERIMVNQEIDFLETTYLDIKKLKEDILSE